MTTRLHNVVTSQKYKFPVILVQCSLLFVFEFVVIFPTAALAIYIQIKPAGNWVKTFYVSFLGSLLPLFFHFLLVVPIFFFVKLWWLSLLLCLWRIILRRLFRLTYCWLALGKWCRFGLYTIPQFFDIIVQEL